MKLPITKQMITQEPDLSRSKGLSAMSKNSFSSSLIPFFIAITGSLGNAGSLIIYHDNLFYKIMEVIA